MASHPYGTRGHGLRQKHETKCNFRIRPGVFPGCLLSGALSVVTRAVSVVTRMEIGFEFGPNFPENASTTRVLGLEPEFLRGIEGSD